MQESGVANTLQAMTSELVVHQPKDPIEFLHETLGRWRRPTFFKSSVSVLAVLDINFN
jgi:hypothetical protein